MRFEFATATRVYFGAGILSEIGKIAGAFGRRVLVIGQNPERANILLTALADASFDTAFVQVRDEPDVQAAVAGTARARVMNAELIIGFGGGSAIDLAKAIAALAVHDGEPLDYLEVIGRGQPLSRPSLPMIAVPTTAGTGAEVTANAVLASAEHGVKVSLRGPTMLPRAAVVDPRLTMTLPPHVTAYTGMDALTQVIEPYVSNKANPVTDALCLEGMRLAANALQRACAEPGDLEARTAMSAAALMGGMALANAKLGAVHGFAAPIGGMFHAPHGAVCAALLSPVIAANIAAMRERQPQHPALGRYETIARLLTGRSDAPADASAAWTARLSADLGIQPLSRYGLREEDVSVVVGKAAASSSMQGNPIVLSAEELAAVLRAAL